MNQENKPVPAAAPAPAAAPSFAARLRAAVAYFAGVFAGLTDARSLVAVIMAMWPLAMCATICFVTWLIIDAEAFWTLPAFVLPLTVFLLRAGPKAPPPAAK
jgi:hypothetical protein